MKGVLLLVLFYGFISLSLRISIAADIIAANQSISDSVNQTLVSPGQTFELGFFSPNKSKNRYLGIWYKNISRTIVWVANRNMPITDSSGVLTIGLDGNIIVLNGSNNIIWSSGSSRSLERPAAQLLDSGNLVLKDLMFGDSDTYLWQSFDYPSDTVIPGMKYGWDLRIGLNRYLTSWKNIDDPSLGEFRSSIDLTGIPQQVVRNGSNTVFRSGALDGVQFTGSFFTSNPVLKGTYVSNADEVYYMNIQNTSVLSRFTMSPWGKLQRFRWDNISLDWDIMFEMPGDQCDKYMYCGVNAVCNSNIAPACGCLQGFIPKSQHEWEVLNWSGGCVRRTPLSCGSGDRFIPIIQVKLPDMVHFLVNKSLGVKECEVECLNNCSCMAYANLNRDSGCIFWFEELFDVRHLIGDGEQDLYIRLAESELEPISNSNKKKRRDVMAISLSGGFALLLLGLIIWFFIWKTMWRNKGGNVESQKEELELPLFDLMTIVVATDNFCPANKIGQGGFGPVYKGRLADGQEIAVKKLSKDSGQGLIEFKNEVILISKLQHRNLVKLLGCCIEGEEKMLVYEYMPNESLDYFIFDQKRSKLLTWQKRLSIIMGIARGLLYLHQDSRLRIIHRDLKASNILLDSNMNPKVSDFGIARIFKGDQTEADTKKVIGTYGYMSPEYMIDGHFSVKSDVFSFGVLVLEMVSAKKNRGFHHENHHHNLIGHAWLLWKAGKAMELIDTSLGVSFSISELTRCIQVSLLCVQQLPEDRPNMSSVVFMLGNESALLPEPKQPGFFIERSSLDGIMDAMTSNLVTISLLEARFEKEMVDLGTYNNSSYCSLCRYTYLEHLHLAFLSAKKKAQTHTWNMDQSEDLLLFDLGFSFKANNNENSDVNRFEKVGKNGVSVCLDLC